jgi:hypothetical protein
MHKASRSQGHDYSALELVSYPEYFFFLPATISPCDSKEIGYGSPFYTAMKKKYKNKYTRVILVLQTNVKPFSCFMRITA